MPTLVRGYLFTHCTAGILLNPVFEDLRTPKVPNNTKAEDEAINSTFGARGKMRLNMVFDAIGFIYPDYCFPARNRGLKSKSALKDSSATPKQKKVKVLTHRSKTYYSERAAELPALPVTENASDLPSKVTIFLDFTLNCPIIILFESFEFLNRGRRKSRNHLLICLSWGRRC
jgi:hypothetical protein